MCLDRVEKKYSFEKPKRIRCKLGPFKVGYKVIKKSRDGKRWSGPVIIERKFPFSRWIVDENIRETWNNYPVGFHLFSTWEDAEHYACPGEIVAKVHYQDVLAEGPDCNMPAVVVKKIKVFKPRVRK